MVDLSVPCDLGADEDLSTLNRRESHREVANSVIQANNETDNDVADELKFEIETSNSVENIDPITPSFCKDEPPKKEWKISVASGFTFFGIFMQFPIGLLVNFFSLFAELAGGKMNFVLAIAQYSNFLSIIGGLVIYLLLQAYVVLYDRAMYSFMVTGIINMFVVATALFLQSNSSPVAYIVLVLHVLLITSSAVTMGSLISLSYLLSHHISIALFTGSTIGALAIFIFEFITSLTSDETKKVAYITTIALSGFFCFIISLLIPRFVRLHKLAETLSDMKNERRKTLRSYRHQSFIGGFQSKLRNGFIVCRRGAPALCVALLGGVETASIVPGVVVLFRPQIDDKLPRYMQNMILMICFFLSDACGKLLSGYWGVIGNKEIWISCISRLLLTPFFIISLAYQPKKIWCTNIYYRSVLIIIFGMSNGWMASMACIKIPDKVEGSNNKEIAGIFAATFVLIGTTLGVLLNPVFDAFE